jgi:ABC-type multidrug transport system fused ATPase/permease subunit
MAINFTADAFMSAVSAAMMFSVSTSATMKLLAGLMALVQALNIAMAIYTAFQGAKYAGPLAGAAFLAYLGIFFAAIASFNSEMKDMQSARVADTGMFATDSPRTYDEGGAVGPRHQLVYVEPGEQIISKTQGMVGMGGANVTVNIGEIYAEDGTDFADKLAEALPNALRRTSYAGGF